ncbi:hypothetical protein BJV74DRAFT_874996 [Russula compacta]|nr:hypothetical protein BJV74DRAFT_874996 [Russula compacta]
MASAFSPTQGEVALVNQIFAKHDPQKFGVITGDVAVNVFGSANLSASTLGQIWGIADTDNQGFLTRKGVSIAVRLVGWAQKGEVISPDLLNKPGPLAVIDGFSSPSEPRRAVSPSPKSPGPSRLPPPLTAQDKARFTRLFNGCGPINGLLSGEKAREVFVRSKLSVEKLSQIWTLSDTHNRGSLDVSDFIVAMYLVQASMSGQLPFIPTTLPPGLYEIASDQTLPGSAIALHTTGNSGSFSPGLPGNFPQNSGSGVIQPQLTGKQLQPQYTGQPLQQQFTGQLIQNQTGSKSSPRNALASASFSAVPSVQSQLAWDVTPPEKANSDKLFDGLDKRRRGYIESDVAVPFMLQSKLPEADLASIWDLADLNNDGRLTRDGFAVAFHLIQGKLTGKEIPTTLPASLMPPSMRAVAIPTTSSVQQPPPDSLNDLIWDDSPVTSHPQATILQPQRTGPLTQLSAISSPQMATPQAQGQAAFASNKGLLDDDDDAGIGASSTAINDHSAEIGNLQNQLQSTTRSLENTKTERGKVEATVQNQAAQLSALQTQLSSAKAAYETESRLLATLRERSSNQSSDIQKAKEELIRAESDLSAIRVEKAEVEQTLLRDKEEVRELQRKMTETGSTIEVTKTEVEKAKKEAKQQRGLLAIAKKQLAAREVERVKEDQELQEALAEAEEATKEREIAEAELSREPTIITTANGLPSAPSPSLSGESFPAAKPLPGTPGSPSSISGSAAGKSNNPFERLAAGSSPQSQSTFLPFANASVPNPAAGTPAQNEGTTTDNPFTFDQAFGNEEARPGPDLEEPERNVQPFTVESTIAAKEEVSPPSSDHDLFITPPTSALDTLGASPNAFTVEPEPLKLPSIDAPSIAPSTDRPLEAHTDMNSQVKELDVNESDSSDEDSEDETPLATLVGRSPPVLNRTEAAKEAPVSNGHASPPPTVQATFPPTSTSNNPFPPVPTKDSSPFSASTSPFAGSPETSKVAILSDFDRTFAAGNTPSFDAAFDDQFDFTKADPSGSVPPDSVTSSSSMAGIAKPSASLPRGSGFENAAAPPVPAIDGLPVLPPVPESKPFSLDTTFTSNLLPASQSAATTHATPNAATPSFDDTFGSTTIQGDSGFGTTSSGTSPIPHLTQSPVSTLLSSSPVQGATSPPPQSHAAAPTSPPLRMASPKGRPSTSSSKESGKEPARHSKLSIRLPFGKKKKTQDSLPPAQHLSPIVDENFRRASPAVDDDVEPVKQLCGMGFSRTQAVAALEASSYDLQKALNSLLNG